MKNNRHKKNESEPGDFGAPVEYPIDGTLDLHLFAPRDTGEAVLEYIRVCLEKKIYQIRIVHGKGIGVKREIVQKLLANHPNVASFRHEGGSGGGWGATVVDLKDY
ncbi:MAG: Smr/MutS family protein [Candidatus Zixiibacteriota bacterium]